MRKRAYRFNLLFILFFIGTLQLDGVSPGAVLLASPEGAVQIVFRLTEQAPTYSVTFQGKAVVEACALSLEFRQAGTRGAGLKITSVHRDAHDETYPLVAYEAQGDPNSNVVLDE